MPTETKLMTPEMRVRMDVIAVIGSLIVPRSRFTGLVSFTMFDTSMWPRTGYRCLCATTLLGERRWRSGRAVLLWEKRGFCGWKPAEVRARETAAEYRQMPIQIQRDPPALLACGACVQLTILTETL